MRHTGFRMLPVAPLPQVDFPVIMVRPRCPVRHQKQWRLPLPRRWTLTWAHCRSQRNDLQQFARQTRIILQFDFDRDINGAARDVRRRSTPRKVCYPAGCPAVRLSQSEPVGCANYDPHADIRYYSQGELYDFASTQLAPTISQSTVSVMSMLAAARCPPYASAEPASAV